MSNHAWCSLLAAGEGSDMAVVIQGYLKEIEELRAKLCESENLCQQLRKQLNNRANNPARLSMSPLHVPMSGEGHCALPVLSHHRHKQLIMNE